MTGLDRRRALRAGAAVMCAWPFARAAAAEPPTAEVTIDNFAFTPQELRVAPGTRVRWTNRDDIPHLVVVPALGAHSPALDTDDTFAATFPAAGRFGYFCSLHPHMQGTVIVSG
jgi:plastocyanin